MGIEPSAKQVPDVAWEYWGWTHPGILAGMYGMNQHRTECHKRLCDHYDLSREETQAITDNLDRYENACQMHDALVEVQKKPNNVICRKE